MTDIIIEYKPPFNLLHSSKKLMCTTMRKTNLVLTPKLAVVKETAMNLFPSNWDRLYYSIHIGGGGGVH